MRFGIIDLGTNTFHLLIVEKLEKDFKTLFSSSIPAKLGKGGIDKNILLPDAQDRAIEVLQIFKEKASEYGISAKDLRATGTSAIRNADNKAEFVEMVFQKTGISIEVVSGHREAELIYLGVKKAVEIEDISLIVDIGGGSVEFILCTSQKVLWMQSFEIGGMRLMERFMKSDPISAADIRKMDAFFRNELLDLVNACHQYPPTVLVGSSGSFDTLIDMYFAQDSELHRDLSQVGFNYPMETFFKAYESIVFNNKEERMQLPGMISLRVEMIVVAVCLIRYLVQSLSIKLIKVSNYSLKEGVLETL